MVSLDTKRIKRNILSLVDFSGLTDISFAYLLGVSDKQIKRIKKDEAEFSISDINKACDFFMKSFEEINNIDLQYESNYRKNLMEAHSGNYEYVKLLTDRPSITYAIKYELLKTKVIPKNGIGVNEIKKIFDSYNWVYSSAYISLALKRNIKLFTVSPNPNRKGSFLYHKRKTF